MKFNNIGIVGLGLIGGSLALAIKSSGVSAAVTGFSRSPSTLDKAVRRGIVDRCCDKFEDGLHELDFLVVATPIGKIAGYLSRLKDSGRGGILVTDVASVKMPVVADASRILGDAGNFVGSHPLAGSEKRGIDSAREGLFRGRYVVITPDGNSKQENVDRIKSFWKSLGSIPVILAPDEHDRLIALTSHLPHLLAYSVMYSMLGFKDKKKLVACSGKGLLDTTRIAASDPGLWAEIFRLNRSELLYWVEEFERCFRELKSDLAEGSFDKLEDKLASAQKLRSRFDEERRYNEEDS